MQRVFLVLALATMMTHTASAVNCIQESTIGGVSVTGASCSGAFCYTSVANGVTAKGCSDTCTTAAGFLCCQTDKCNSAGSTTAGRTITCLKEGNAGALSVGSGNTCTTTGYCYKSYTIGIVVKGCADSCTTKENLGYYCCNSDKCNGAEQTIGSFWPMLVPLVVLLF